MRVEFGRDGCAIHVVAETDSDRVALAAWLKRQEAEDERGRGTLTDPRLVLGSCRFQSAAWHGCGDPVGPERVSLFTS